jgi:hypothetical protein
LLQQFSVRCSEVDIECFGASATARQRMHKY